jgi:hypothetical protein
MAAKEVILEDEPEEIDPSLVPPSVVHFMHFGEQVNRIRGGAGLLGFIIVGILVYRHTHSLVAATERALIAAFVLHMVGWLLWILIAKSMRKDAIQDLTRLRDEGFSEGDSSK